MSRVGYDRTGLRGVGPMIQTPEGHGLVVFLFVAAAAFGLLHLVPLPDGLRSAGAFLAGGFFGVRAFLRERAPPAA